MPPKKKGKGKKKKGGGECCVGTRVRCHSAVLWLESG